MVWKLDRLSQTPGLWEHRLQCMLESTPLPRLCSMSPHECVLISEAISILQWSANRQRGRRAQTNLETRLGLFSQLENRLSGLLPLMRLLGSSGEPRLRHST